VDAAFAVLDAVGQGAMTQWQIVYDVEQLQIFFTTSAHPHVRRIALSGLDFTCASPRTRLDLTGEEAERWTPYTIEQGHGLLQRVVSQLAAVGFFQQTPTATEIEQFSRYPDTVVCGP
jgi:hypothetical protein